MAEIRKVDTFNLFPGTCIASGHRGPGFDLGLEVDHDGREHRVYLGNGAVQTMALDLGWVPPRELEKLQKKVDELTVELAAMTAERDLAESTLEQVAGLRSEPSWARKERNAEERGRRSAFREAQAQIDKALGADAPRLSARKSDDVPAEPATQLQEA